MKKYIDFEDIPLEKLTPNTINNCYDCIDRKLIQNKLDDKDILPEVRLYYEVE